MNINDYKKLQKNCDKYLEHIKDIPHIAFISWLHISRPHPKNMKDYENLIYNLSYSKKNNLYKGVKKKFYSYLKIFLKLIKYLFSPKFPFYKTFDDVIKSTDVLIISHLISKDVLPKNEDFYFGNIQNVLKKNKINSMLIMHNQNKFNIKKIIKKFKSKGMQRILLSNNLNIFEEIKIIIKIFLLKNLLTRKFVFSNNKSYEIIFKNQLINECLSESTISLFRFHFQISKIIKKYKPKKIFLTYEGFAWERIAFYSAKKINKDIVTIGYQHASINNYYHSIKRNLGFEFDADIIATAGKYGSSILSSEKYFKIERLINIGTHRKFKIYSKLEYKKDAILVIPEGIIDECIILYKFSLKCAFQNPNINFIWRIHPILTFNKLKKNIDFENLPKNVIISYNSIENDFANSKFSFYRGSTLIINAIQNNIIPIFINIDNNEIFDPLLSFNDSRLKIEKPEQLADIIKDKKITLDHNLYNFSTDYYNEFNEIELIKIFKKN